MYNSNVEGWKNAFFSGNRVVPETFFVLIIRSQFPGLLLQVYNTSSCASQAEGISKKILQATRPIATDEKFGTNIQTVTINYVYQQIT